MAMAFEVRLAVLIAEIIQVILGCAKAGALSASFPSSVIKGLSTAIRVILIIKQTPYLLGYDMVPRRQATDTPIF
jgi:carbonic anhydrase